MSTDLSPQVRPHPPGLYTLFLVEMWERFSYYGMRALLVLFMVDQERGGMALGDSVATSIYGLYTAGVYLAALPGGWVADRLLGARKAVWYGGIIIALGQFMLVIEGPRTFFLGLLLVMVGTGLLKPNISAIVGELYASNEARRDAGFTIFYMGINIGAFLGPLVGSFLGERFNWHYGFGVAGVGMVLGLIVYRLRQGTLGPAGLAPGNPHPLGRGLRLALLCLSAGVVLVLGLALAGVLRVDPVHLARRATVLIGLTAILYFAGILLFAGLDRGDRKRVCLILVLFLASALFWAGFEQVGSSFNLFAERYTERVVAALDFTIPTGWFQSLGAIFVVLLAPVVASLWTGLARRGWEPSMLVKFASGLILLAAGFVVMAMAARAAGSGARVWPTWLMATYLLHTIGELALSPVGLSSVTRLSPRRLVGQMMGVWFLAASLGSLIAGLLAGRLSGQGLENMPNQFLQMALLPFLAGLLLLALAKPLGALVPARSEPGGN